MGPAASTRASRQPLVPRSMPQPSKASALELGGNHAHVFPGQVQVAAAEVAVGRHFAVEVSSPLLGQVAQLEVFDDGAGAQIEIGVDQLGELVVAVAAGAETLHQDA